MESSHMCTRLALMFANCSWRRPWDADPALPEMAPPGMVANHGAHSRSLTWVEYSRVGRPQTHLTRIPGIMLPGSGILTFPE